ncbi:MAG: DEAD/DEAH box helicase [Desulfobulbaceae bacterium]|nr:DEAD/DEAH box helicase [Desulfobulbaceae bacterium]
MPQTIQPVETLIQRYESLPVFAKTVLELCSIIYEAVDVSTLIRCLYRSGITSETNRQSYGREIQPCLELLQKNGLLTPRLECEPGIIESISRAALANQHFQPMAEAVMAELPAIKSPIFSDNITYAKAVRNLRIALYTLDINAFHQLLINHERVLNRNPHPIVAICNQPFAAEWFSTLPDHIQFLALHEILKASLSQLEPINCQLDYFEHSWRKEPPPIDRHDSFLYLLISGRLLQGEITLARELINKHKKRLATYGFSGWLHFIMGDYDKALLAFENDLVKLRALNKNENAYFTGFEGLICFLCLLRVDNPDYPRLHNILLGIKNLQAQTIHHFTYEILAAVIHARESKSDSLSMGLNYQSQNIASVDALFLGLADYWVEGRLEPGLQMILSRYCNMAIKSGYRWLAREFAELLYLTTREPHYQEMIENFQAENPTVPLLAAITYEEPWQKAIRELQKIADRPDNGSQTQAERLIWLIETNQDGTITGISPREQKMTESGLWSKGRTLALKKIAQQDLPYLSDYDQRICLALRAEKDTIKGASYYFDLDQALIASVNHPLIFRDDNHGMPIEVISKAPELHIQHGARTVQIHFLPFPHEDKSVICQFESTSRLAVYQISATHRHIADIVGPYGLHVPVDAKDEVLQMIGGVATHLNIHSDLSSQASHLKTIEADRTTYCHLVPVNNGFHLSMLVRPLKEGGQYLRPGQGSRTIIAEIQGKGIQVCRDLFSESQRAHAAVAACPSLYRHDIDNWEWLINDVPDCLQLLHELQSLPQGIVVEWPKGELLKLNSASSNAQLYLKIKQRRNWFELDGQLQIDDDTVLDMSRVLELIKKSHSRFIPMSDGHFVALSHEMYQQLDQVNGIIWPDKDHLQFSALAAPLILELTQCAAIVETDQSWQDLEKRVRLAATYTPTIPSTLQTELRPYQIEGFHWLSRLAYLGFGACLADEMGLGKTIQALTLMLDQAQHGPILVIAPTSVCFNWIDEASRFAPTLKLQLFGGAERQKMVHKLASFDVLVTTYGLLQQEHEILCEKQWQVIVLDEAQAIKNMSTKRSRAAMDLKSRFKLITTGTPLENNLGELWNLFTFINPGLLGTISQFNKRFAGPIERDKDRDSQKRLRKLVGPFILRRLKSQVLDDLPPRTEINLQVSLNDDESAFYESLRRTALDKLEKQQVTGNRQLQILAEIMRLRRACCNPALVAPGINIQSSKMTLFEEIIEELLANRHKILVFSQFVDHLSIIKKFLDNKGISYQYLDGSTPTRQRKIRVDAFQAGQGDIFLISLKAGGLGLNLTAANYVIHMDPWWNPAVEDQASDRAHRIGQKLPVTIYRLITKNTIEEKIVTLHRDKRELAENLLKGTEVTDKVSADDLLQLLKDASTS